MARVTEELDFNLILFYLVNLNVNSHWFREFFRCSEPTRVLLKILVLDSSNNTSLKI